MIVPVPIFIYKKEKSDKELREEMAREARWRKLIEEDEARRRAREREEKEKKRTERELKEKQANEAYEALRRKDEWQTLLLPEGWSIFGQRCFDPISLFYEDEMSV